MVAVLATGAASSTAGASPDDLVGAPIVLGRNQIAAQLTVEYNLATGNAGVPLSLAPDVWWGVSPRLTLGLIHSNQSVDEILPGASFCLRTNDAAMECLRTYHGSGVDARYLVLDDGTWSIAPRARFLIRDLDPFKPAVTAGALARWHRGRFAIIADPYLQLGLDNLGDGNRARLVLPVYLAVQPTRRLELALQTGWQSDLAVLGDGWHLPAGVIVRGDVTHGFELGTEVGFTSPLGPQNDVKQRVLWLWLGWKS
jgi:hypothetical protein